MLMIAYNLRISYHKDPLLLSLVFLVLSSHIYYETYKKRKETEILDDSKNKKLEKLKKNPKLQIVLSNVPEELVEYIDVISQWGIGNKLLREDLYEKSSQQDLYILKNFIDSKFDIINYYIANLEDKNTKNALRLTLKAYNDLGLWTWDCNKASINNEPKNHKSI